MHKKKIIYVAGPLFSEHERNYLEELVHVLSKECSLDPMKDFFLPHRDAGDVGISNDRKNTFDADLKALDSAEIIVALLDGQDVDSGTAVEIGYAFAKGKTILGLLTDFRRSITAEGQISINNMIWGTCGMGKEIFRDIDSLARALRVKLQDVG